MEYEMQDIAEMIGHMEGKDTKETYQELQQLEQISDEAGALYTYTQKFADMIASEKYIIRVRGFRLFCKQAKWDKDNIIDENIDDALSILKDDRPTAVRQALAAMADVIRYKPDLRDMIGQAVNNIQYLRYKDTMHSLIAKDIQLVQTQIKECS